LDKKYRTRSIAFLYDELFFLQDILVVEFLEIEIIARTLIDYFSYVCQIHWTSRKRHIFFESWNFDIFHDN